MQSEFNFHKQCSRVEIVDVGGQAHIVCFDCGVIANLEAVSKKITPEDVCKVGRDIGRSATGKSSAGITLQK